MVTEPASLRVKLRGSLELAGRLRPPPLTLCDNNPPREGGPRRGRTISHRFRDPSPHPPWEAQSGTISSDFSLGFGDTSGMGALASPSTLAPPPPPRREGTARVGTSICRKNFCRESGFFATRNRGERSHHTPQAPQPTPHTTAHTTTQEEEGRGGEGGNSFSECCLLQKRPSRGRTSFLLPSSYDATLPFSRSSSALHNPPPQSPPHRPSASDHQSLGKTCSTTACASAPPCSNHRASPTPGAGRAW